MLPYLARSIRIKALYIAFRHHFTSIECTNGNERTESNFILEPKLYFVKA